MCTETTFESTYGGRLQDWIGSSFEEISHTRQPTLTHNATTSKQGQVKVVINEHIYVPSLDQ